MTALLSLVPRQVDAVFCCLPHATTQQIIKSLPTNLKIVDLSADFRLRDVNTYAQWWVRPGRRARGLLGPVEQTDSLGSGG